jgi:(S)-2-hydroxy-acid oxidase
MTFTALDVEANAAKNMQQDLYQYYSLGACDNLTLARNREIFKKILVTPRVLRDTCNITTTTQLFKTNYALPLLIAPMAFLKAAHAVGEIAVANAAQSNNVGFILSTMSNTPIEEITSPIGKRWFQLYPFHDKAITSSLVKRAQTSGYDAIVVTVDLPIMGNRRADIINNFTLPAHLGAANLNEFFTSFSSKPGSAIKHFTDLSIDRSFNWEDVAWLKSITSLPILLKGIMHTSDALLAVEHGVNGIIISNHGGRQLDTMPSTMEVLPAIKALLPASTLVLIDSGFRTGLDIFKAIALGADGVLLGRPVIWALHQAGEMGINSLLQTIKLELESTMILSGFRTITELKAHGNECVNFDGTFK